MLQTYWSLSTLATFIYFSSRLTKTQVYGLSWVLAQPLFLLADGGYGRLYNTSPLKVGMVWDLSSKVSHSATTCKSCLELKWKGDRGSPSTMSVAAPLSVGQEQGNKPVSRILEQVTSKLKYCGPPRWKFGHPNRWEESTLLEWTQEPFIKVQIPPHVTSSKLDRVVGSANGDQQPVG